MGGPPVLPRILTQIKRLGKLQDASLCPNRRPVTPPLAAARRGATAATVPWQYRGGSTSPTTFCHPSHFIARMMQPPVVNPTERHRELVADLAAHGPRLGELEMMRATGCGCRSGTAARRQIETQTACRRSPAPAWWRRSLPSRSWASPMVPPPPPRHSLQMMVNSSATDSSSWDGVTTCDRVRAL